MRGQPAFAVRLMGATRRLPSFDVVALVDNDDRPGIRLMLPADVVHVDFWAQDAAHFVTRCSAALAEALGRADAIAEARRRRSENG